MNRLGIVGLMTGLLFAFSTADAQFFGIETGLVDGVSDTGVVSGSIGADGHYFVWTMDGGLEDIGGVSPGGGVGGSAEISNDGRYISGTAYNAAEDYHEMSRYDRVTGTWTGFGPTPKIGTQSGTEVSAGWSISGDGQSVVGLGWVQPSGAHAIQWTEGVGSSDLGSTVAGRSSRANGTDFDGDVVVGWQDNPTGFRQGAVWVNGVQKLIFDNEEGRAQEASVVSDDGVWVSGYSSTGSFYRYNTQTSVYESLPNVDNGFDRISGADMTADGSTIVGGTWPFGPATFGDAIIWQEGIGTQLLSDYLADFNITVPSNTLNFARSISSDGRWIAGWRGLSATIDDSWVIRIPFGDFDRNGEYECADVDALVAEIVSGTNNTLYDLTGDDLVNADDLAVWREDAGFALNSSRNPILEGDANLDGVVDTSDYGIWNAHKFTNTAAWCSGDFNADGSVDVPDYSIWNAYRFQSSNASNAMVVPEPSALGLSMIGLLLLALRRRS